MTDDNPRQFTVALTEDEIDALIWAANVARLGVGTLISPHVLSAQEKLRDLQELLDHISI